ncbi:DUF4177 domain-containing protein [Thermoproteota archaeon]
MRIRVKGLFTPTPEKDYQEIISKRAKDGWILIQIFASGIGPYGRPIFYDLIFHKKQ